MATWLSLVNGVQRRLRSQVTATVGSTTYSQLLGKFVNDAKREVEDAWDWTALRSVKTITTVASTDEYSVDGTDHRTRIMYGWNATKGHRLYRMGHNRYYSYIHGTNVTEGTVNAYLLTGVDASTDKLDVSVYPRPSEAESIKLYCVVPEDDMAADSDTIVVPSQPVELLAWTFALVERGEDGGFDKAQAAVMAQSALTDAIARDVSMVSEEVTIVPV